MKALSVRQPYAALIVSGLKTIECRSWATQYRGPLLICSALSWANGDYEIPEDMLWSYPLGCAVGMVNLISCVPFKNEHLEPAGLDYMPYLRGYAWLLRDAKEIEPFTVKGRQGLFEISCNIA